MGKKKILENWKLSDFPYFLYINKEKIMEENKSKFYSLMVVGDNPLEMIKKYDAGYRFAIRHHSYEYCETVLYAW